MTGMEIARELKLSEEILRAVEHAQPLDVSLDSNDPWKTVAALDAYFEQDNGIGILRFYLDWAAALKAQYDALEIPEKIFWDGVRDIAIWVEDYQQKHGGPGFKEWGWVAGTLTMGVFRLGRLQFQPDRLEAAMECDGVAYPGGTPILNIHIPAGEPLDGNAVRAAMEEAPRFFHTYFGTVFTLFQCHSWLLSPKLKKLLPADSRIIQFQDLFSAFEADDERQAEERVFGFLADDPADYPDNTSLQRKMKAALLAGESFGMGRGYRVIP